MSKSQECPKCGADISDSFQDDDFDVGIAAGWYCDACNLGVPYEGYEPHDDDVALFGSGNPSTLTDLGHSSSGCKSCGTLLESGYGLAGGGGIGPYMYCPNPACKDPTFIKVKENP